MTRSSPRQSGSPWLSACALYFTIVLLYCPTTVSGVKINNEPRSPMQFFGDPFGGQDKGAYFRPRVVPTFAQVHWHATDQWFNCLATQVMRSSTGISSVDRYFYDGPPAAVYPARTALPYSSQTFTNWQSLPSPFGDIPNNDPYNQVMWVPTSMALSADVTGGSTNPVTLVAGVQWWTRNATVNGSHVIGVIESDFQTWHRHVLSSSAKQDGIISRLSLHGAADEFLVATFSDSARLAVFSFNRTSFTISEIQVIRLEAVLGSETIEPGSNLFPRWNWLWVSGAAGAGSPRVLVVAAVFSASGPVRSVVAAVDRTGATLWTTEIGSASSLNSDDGGFLAYTHDLLFVDDNQLEVVTLGHAASALVKLRVADGVVLSRIDLPTNVLAAGGTASLVARQLHLVPRLGGECSGDDVDDAGAWRSGNEYMPAHRCVILTSNGSISTNTTSWCQAGTGAAVIVYAITRAVVAPSPGSDQFNAFEYGKVIAVPLLESTATTAAAVLSTQTIATQQSSWSSGQTQPTLSSYVEGMISGHPIAGTNESLVFVPPGGAALTMDLLRLTARIVMPPSGWTPHSMFVLIKEVNASMISLSTDWSGSWSGTIIVVSCQRIVSRRDPLPLLTFYTGDGALEGSGQSRIHAGPSSRWYTCIPADRTNASVSLPALAAQPLSEAEALLFRATAAFTRSGTTVLQSSRPNVPLASAAALQIAWQQPNINQFFSNTDLTRVSYDSSHVPLTKDGAAFRCFSAQSTSQQDSLPTSTVTLEAFSVGDQNIVLWSTTLFFFFSGSIPQCKHIVLSPDERYVFTQAETSRGSYLNVVDVESRTVVGRQEARNFPELQSSSTAPLVSRNFVVMGSRDSSTSLFSVTVLSLPDLVALATTNLPRSLVTTSQGGSSMADNWAMMLNGLVFVGAHESVVALNVTSDVFAQPVWLWRSATVAASSLAAGNDVESHLIRHTLYNPAIGDLCPNSTVVVAVPGSRVIVALDMDSGAMLWRASVPVMMLTSRLACVNASATGGAASRVLVLYAGFNNSQTVPGDKVVYLGALDAATGASAWFAQAESTSQNSNDVMLIHGLITSMVAGEEEAFVMIGGNLFVVQLQTGASTRFANVGGGSQVIPLLADFTLTDEAQTMADNYDTSLIDRFDLLLSLRPNAQLLVSGGGSLALYGCRRAEYGSACTKCVPGYYRFESACRACPDYAFLYIVLIVVVFVAFIVILGSGGSEAEESQRDAFMRDQHDRGHGRVSTKQVHVWGNMYTARSAVYPFLQLLHFLQIGSVFVNMAVELNIEIPEFLKVFNVFNFVFTLSIDMAGPECAQLKWDWVRSAAVTIAAPWIMAITLALAGLLAFVLGKGRKVFLERMGVSVCVVLFLPTTVATINAFTCKDLAENGIKYLSQDMSINCDSDEYRRNVLPIGIVGGLTMATIAGVLVHISGRVSGIMRGVLTRASCAAADDSASSVATPIHIELDDSIPEKDREFLKGWGYLFEQYTPERGWFEVFILLRKAALIGITTYFLGSGLEGHSIYNSWMLLIFFVFIVAAFPAFRSQFQQYVEVWLALVEMAIGTCLIWGRNDNHSGDDDRETWAAGVEPALLTFVCVSIVLVVLLMLWRLASANKIFRRLLPSLMSYVDSRRAREEKEMQHKMKTGEMDHSMSWAWNRKTKRRAPGLFRAGVGQHPSHLRLVWVSALFFVPYCVLNLALIDEALGHARDHTASGKPVDEFEAQVQYIWLYFIPSQMIMGIMFYGLAMTTSTLRAHARTVLQVEEIAPHRLLRPVYILAWLAALCLWYPFGNGIISPQALDHSLTDLEGAVEDAANLGRAMIVLVAVFVLLSVVDFVWDQHRAAFLWRLGGASSRHPREENEDAHDHHHLHDHHHHRRHDHHHHDHHRHQHESSLPPGNVHMSELSLNKPAAKRNMALSSSQVYPVEGDNMH